MATNKRDIGEIDESLLLSSIKEKEPQKAERVKPVKEEIQVQEAEAEPVLEKPKETAKRKRNNAVDYTSTFLQKNEIKTRQCVYISQRIHATITEIVRVIADKDITVGGYIDNVLLQHLEANKDEINDLYKRDRKDLIEWNSLPC